MEKVEPSHEPVAAPVFPESDMSPTAEISSDTSAAAMNPVAQASASPANQSPAGEVANVVSENKERSPFDRPPNIELPSIGMVTGMKPPASNNIPSITKSGPLQRPNIIQLPGNMIPPPKLAMGPALQSMPPHAVSGPHNHPSSTVRMLSPSYGSAPHGYGPLGMPSSQGYHGSAQQPPPPAAPVPPKMELHDAFAYLDRVKAEFADQPDVYNRFLQIMREFKANA